MPENDVFPEGCEGFDFSEVSYVVKEYVCFVCHTDLTYLQVPNSSLCIIVCPEHGNVEKCGRVMKSTVSIEMERSALEYREVVRNLADLWPGMVEEGFEYVDAERIRKHYVCKRCGGMLIMQFVGNKSMLVSLKCNVCKSNIEKDGYKKKEKKYGYIRAN